MTTVTRLRRLLVTLPSDRMGGTEKHTAELCMRLAQKGLTVMLAADPALHAALARPGLALAPLATTAAMLADHAPDAAFIPLPWPDAGHAILPGLAEMRLPRLVLLHLAPDAPPPATAPAMGLEGAVVAAVSVPVARRAETAWGLPPGRVTVLDNPAPPPSMLDRAVARAAIRSGLGLPPDASLLLFLGRLEEVKGATLLPEISARLPVTLAVAGDGPLRGMLDSAAASDPRRLLRMLGSLADPAPWLRGADALLMPSRLEGAPLVFLEAAAQQCPVVATPAALEALGGAAGSLARLAETADAAGMAAAAQAVLDDPAAAAAMAARAAAHAARLTWEGAVTQALALLRAAVPAARRAA